MKNLKQTIFKTSIFATAFIALLTTTSCNNNGDLKDTKEIAEDSNDAKFTNDYEDDAEYLVSAAEINLEEIQLGRLAQKNSSMPQVVELGKMMEDEHTKALKELQTLAAKKQISLPSTITNDGKDANDKLKNKFGVEFDKEYCDMMIKGHKDAISKFEKASTDAKDLDIQSWAATFLISLKSHLAHSEACKEECAKMKSKS